MHLHIQGLEYLLLFLQLGHTHVKREPSITLDFNSGSKSTLTESHTVYDPSVLQAGHVIFIFLNDDIELSNICMITDKFSKHNT